MNRKTIILILVALFIIAFVIRYVALGQLGITMDEPVYVKAGLMYVKDIVGNHISQDAFSYNSEHPPVAKYIYGAAEYVFNGKYGYDAFITARTVSATLGALTCLIVFLFGSRFFNVRVGIVAALILALTPMFIAHGILATLDSPLTFLLTATIFAFAVAVEKKSLKLYALSAVLFGLSLSTKYNALLILPIMAIFFIISRKDVLKVNAGKYALAALAWVGIVLLLFVMIWPFLWSDPVGGLQTSLDHWGYKPSFYFLGQTVSPPIPYYYVAYFLVTTPEVLLLLSLIGTICLLNSKNSHRYLLLMWLLIPFLYGFSSMVQGSMRYVLMIYPALALISAYGIDELSGLLGKHSRKDLTFICISAFTIIALLLTCLSIQPYYLDYYNSLSGGYKNIQDNHLFLLSWWGEGMHAPLTYIESNSNNATVGIMTYWSWNNGDFYNYAKNNKYTFINGSNYKPNWVNESNYDYLIMSRGAEKSVGMSPHKYGYDLVYTEKIGGVTAFDVYRKKIYAP